METSLDIEQVTFGGRGLGRLEGGKVCFVPWVIAGERVRVRLTRERKNMAEANLEEVLTASPDRVVPPCPVFGRCGGCHYQHIAYERQLTIKRDQVADVLRRIGGWDAVPVEPPVPSPREYGYRNRITVHARGGAVGFFAAKSHAVVDVDRCPIATDAVNAQLADLRGARVSDGEYPLREPGEYRGFRQVNDAAAELLAQVVRGLAEPGGEVLVDAYCGAGFFTRRLEGLFRRAVGIEWSPDAVRAARRQAGSGEEFLLGDVGGHLPGVLAGLPAGGTTVLLDPPAEGVDPAVTHAVIAHSPNRIIYVSCNPSTLARDLRALAGGYRPIRVRPVDMFPQTAEIEVVALLEKIP